MTFACEHLCLERDTLHFKQQVALKYADLVYYGQWFHPLREALDVFVNKVQEHTTGTVKVKLLKGRAIEQFEELSVNRLLFEHIRTGAVKILRYVVVHDCGRMINPMMVEGQVQGGG